MVAIGSVVMSGGHVPHLAVALDGAGWHPAAWREPDARPEGLFGARYWADLVLEAESGLLDFVTIDDRLALQSSLPYALTIEWTKSGGAWTLSSSPRASLP